MIKIARSKRVTQKEVAEGYRRLAFGDIQSAVMLLYEPDEEALKKLDGFDLFNVSEIKRAKGGGMEIKFFDRLKALEKLYELASSSQSKTGGSIFDALEQSAKLSKNIGGDELS